MVNVGMHLGSVLSPFLIAEVIDDVTEFSKESVLGELLHAVDIVLMSETIKGLKNKFLKWKEVFESKGLKVNNGKTEIMVSNNITKDGLSKSKIDPCAVCSLKVKANTLYAYSVVNGSK